LVAGAAVRWLAFFVAAVLADVALAAVCCPSDLVTELLVGAFAAEVRAADFFATLPVPALFVAFAGVLVPPALAAVVFVADVFVADVFATDDFEAEDFAAEVLPAAAFAAGVFAVDVFAGPRPGAVPADFVVGVDLVTADLLVLVAPPLAVLAAAAVEAPVAVFLVAIFGVAGAFGPADLAGAALAALLAVALLALVALDLRAAPRLGAVVAGAWLAVVRRAALRPAAPAPAGCLAPRVAPPRPRSAVPASLRTPWTKPKERPASSAILRILSPALYLFANCAANASRCAPVIREPLVSALATMPPLIRSGVAGRCAR
jgi:hypothetical protein